ncbi:hypothetical protein AMAG_19923 [Allomyces macrogynus ATCC 38327]|uniref:Uncharacterized protein n=1 Tax=Allomyces macrogynus (strain ATCC 38327) TaxID=578462 RepID=A0A0L0T3T4_ALLM3|nr:hypothetical protein AMAG_19923 [Allomyces macrogynus ATCC 38327]|eukprot:KNE69407.1 hypothetical protein AMAG_19923 [Allomyces macrogynus ATCC 38327]
MRVKDIESVLRTWRAKNLPIPTVAATNAIRIARIGGKSPFRALTWVTDPPALMDRMRQQTEHCGATIITETIEKSDFSARPFCSGPKVPQNPCSPNR